MKYIKKVKPFFTDERGSISKIVDDESKITSALYLTCKKGAIRANHYHKKDTHYSYLISGKMEYTFQDLKSKSAKKKSVIVNAGEVVYTPAMTMHAMKFLEDSVFIALATEHRSKKNYENDTIRVEFVK